MNYGDPAIIRKVRVGVYSSYATVRRPAGVPDASGAFDGFLGNCLLQTCDAADLFGYIELTIGHNRDSS